MAEHDKPRIPRQARSKETKRRIVAAGLRIFGQKGFFRTNSKEIAWAAGVSTGGFYMYFKDKQELFKEVVIAYQTEIKRVMQGVNIQKYVRANDIRGFLRYVMKKLIEAHDISPGFHQELIVMAQSDPAIREIKNDSIRESIELTRRMLEEWKSGIRVSDLDTAAVLIQRTTEEAIHTIMFSGVAVSGKKLTDQLIEMLFHYLTGA